MNKKNHLFLFIFKNIYMKKLIYSIFIITTMLFSIVLSSNAETIENEANVTYQDINKKIYNQNSDKRYTDVKERQNLGVSLIVPQPRKIVDVNKNWYFPAYVLNTGKENDKYKLKIDFNSLDNIDIKIYYDVNSNKTLDSDDILSSETAELAPNESYPIIISFVDNVINNEKKSVKSKFSIQSISTTELIIKTTVSATSLKDSNVKDIKNIYSIITFTTTIDNNNGGNTDTPTDTTKKPDIVIRKSVYPTTPVQEGDVLTYTIEVRNRGEASANTVRILDKLPTDVYLDDSSVPTATNNGEVKYSNDGTTWDSKLSTTASYIRAEWKTLNVGQVVSLYFYVKVKAGAESSQIENRAFAEYKEDQNLDNSIETQVLRKDSNLTVLKLRNEYYIDGTIYDKKTGLPKENVTVIVYDLDGNKIGTYLTGKTGEFRIDVPKKGEYRTVYVDETGRTISETKSWKKWCTNRNIRKSFK